MRRRYPGESSTWHDTRAGIVDVSTSSTRRALRIDTSHSLQTQSTSLRLRTGFTEIFGEEFPVSAATTVTRFADPDMLIEFQGGAVRN